MNNLVHCTRIGVDCVVNDPVDVRCGGPEYLGFDFNVPTEETESSIKFIKIVLNEFHVPLIKMYTNGEIDLDEKKVWSKERIVDAIDQYASYLQLEESRDYSSSRK